MTSFFSERTAEYSILPPLVEHLAGRFGRAVPIFLWSDREGNITLGRIHEGIARPIGSWCRLGRRRQRLHREHLEPRRRTSMGEWPSQRRAEPGAGRWPGPGQFEPLSLGGSKGSCREVLGGSALPTGPAPTEAIPTGRFTWWFQ